MRVSCLPHLLMVLLLTGCATAGASAPSAPNHITTGRALEREVAQQLPARNLYQLTNELKLRPPRTIPHVARHTNPNYPIGHQDKFDVLSEDQNHYFILTATIRAKTPHLYVYAENGLHVSDADLRRAAIRFERKTYPTDRKNFGSEWIPGVDGDPHITCILGDLRSSHALGYFSSEDEYTHLVNPHSNQRELFYINSANTVPGSGNFDSTLSHEFQHMIHWHMHAHENLWLNEGMSMLAEQLNGFSAAGEADAFLSQPQTQLNAWSSNDFPHYGAAYLFLSYLRERFGSGFIRAMVADTGMTDLELFDDTIRRLHLHTTSRRLFAQWTAANYIADRSVGASYGYAYLSHRVDTRSPKTVPFSYHGTVPPYAADYTVMDGLQKQKAFRLQFSAPATVPAVSVSGNPPFWWSSRGDMAQTALQRQVDLTHVRHASLHFQAWWDIEKDYDYAYVEASRDGGKTYSLLKATDTTSVNPHGASYGNAFTGSSKGWKDQTVNLSAYAGHKATLRFQYVTDDGQNSQGLVMRNIAIPEIGFHDGYSGWTQRGFLPLSSNALPSDWMVQLVSYTAKGVKVSQMPLSPSKQGSIDVDPSRDGLKKLVVIVFTTAPKTTVETSYQLSAN